MHACFAYLSPHTRPRARSMILSALFILFCGTKRTNIAAVILLFGGSWLASLARSPLDVTTPVWLAHRVVA